MKVRITNIQRFSLQDGPGIRTTIFLKGCSLRCPWCSNPENLSYEIQDYHLDNKDGVYGKDIDLKDLYNEIIKDKKYYSKNDGGVTFSGGEALLQFDKLEPLLKKLKEEKINMCLETSLVAPLENLKIAVNYIDEFYVDVKLCNKDQFENVLKGNYDLYMSNIDYLCKNIEKTKITFRMPVTKEYTFNKNNLEEIETFFQKYKANSIEIFQVHNLGESKYKSLNLPIKHFEKVDALNEKELISILNKYFDNVIINKI